MPTSIQTLFLTAVACLLATSAAAQAVDTRTAEAALEKAFPGLEVDHLQPSPMPGMLFFQAQGHSGLVSTDGRYLLDGDLVDLRTRRSLSEIHRSALRATALRSGAPSSALVYPGAGGANPSKTVHVFTDVSCGYCRLFHRQVAELNRAGITVAYYAWPREGADSSTGQTMRSVWCAADRKAAFDAAMAEQTPRHSNCADPVATHIRLGQQLGVNATPAVFAADGTQLGGMVDAAVIRQHIESTTR
jgi:thiol:disulfide interchange protein DsbC